MREVKKLRDWDGEIAKGFGETHSHRVGGGGGEEVTDSFCFCSLLLLFFSVTFSVLCAHLRASSNQMILNWKVYYWWIANSQGSSRAVHVRELNAPNGSVLFMGFSNQSLLRNLFMGFVRSKPILSSINHSKKFKSKTRRVVKEIKCKKVKRTSSFFF